MRNTNLNQPFPTENPELKMSISEEESSFHSSSKDQSSASGTSDFTGTSSGRSKLSAAEEEELAKMESKYIRFSKILVLSILFISATVAGAVSYIFSKNGEQNTFELQVRS